MGSPAARSRVRLGSASNRSRVMAKVRVAVIGAGILGSRHARVFHEHDQSETVAVVDVDETRAKTVADRHGARAYTSLDALFGTEELDALAIATPDHLHREPAAAARTPGQHLLLQKPLATPREAVSAL